MTTPTRPMKLVAYLRVSTIEQTDKGYGLDVQRQAIGLAALQIGAKVIAWHTDEGKSGALDAADRPGLLTALAAVRAGGADGLIVRDLDRLARAVGVQEAVLAEVWGKNAVVYTSTPPAEVPRDDPDDPMRTAMRQMRGVFHELDRRLIAKRLRNGRKTKASNGGHVNGPAPYGWRTSTRTDTNPHGALVEVPAEQAVLRKIHGLAAQGVPTREIARVLNAEGYRTKRGAEWSSPTVSRILNRDSRKATA